MAAEKTETATASPRRGREPELGEEETTGTYMYLHNPRHVTNAMSLRGQCCHFSPISSSNKVLPQHTCHMCRAQHNNLHTTTSRYIH